MIDLYANLRQFSPPTGRFDQQIMLQGRKFDKEISKMSNSRGFARPLGGGVNK